METRSPCVRQTSCPQGSRTNVMGSVCLLWSFSVELFIFYFTSLLASMLFQSESPTLQVEFFNFLRTVVGRDCAKQMSFQTEPVQ